MKTYKVKHGQNIFDVAMTLFGSIEGIFDLLAYNDDLSFDSKLNGGEELVYNEEFVINPQIVSSMQDRQLIPVNSERNVYYKPCEQPLVLMLRSELDTLYTSFMVSGDGTMYVDWGDDNDIETISLTPKEVEYRHVFDTYGNTIKIYGTFNLKHFDMSGMNGGMYLLRPVVVDEIRSSKNNLTLSCLFLCKGTYSVSLDGMLIDTLDGIRDMSLSDLVLRDNVYFDENMLDDYFVYIAKNHNERRACHVVIDKELSGTYKEPAKDSVGNYIIKTGMEAVYVITHEVAWNEAGPWVFDICGKVYKYENTDIA